MRRVLLAVLMLGLFSAASAEAQTFSRLGPLAGGAAGATFTGGTVPDATTFSSAVTIEGTLNVTGLLTSTNRIDAVAGMKLFAGKDLTCASPNSCELGASTNYLQRIHVNQVDATVLRGRVSGAALDANEADGLIISHVESATPAAPHACTVAADFGLITIVNDSDDSTASTVCYCGQQADDSTYDWLVVGADTACPHF